MDGNGAGAGRLHGTRKVRAHDVVGHAADPDLHGDGNVELLSQRPHDARGKHGVIEQRGARPSPRDLGNRARHVHVNEREALPNVLAELARSLAEVLGVGTEQLHGKVRLAHVGLHERPGLVAAVVNARD